MRLVFIADIHGNLPALRAVLAEVGDLKVYCAGDFVGYNPWPEEVVSVAREGGFVSVLGNHDAAVLAHDESGESMVAAVADEWTESMLSEDSYAYLSSLPDHLLVEEHSIYMVHGSPRRRLDEYVYPDHPYMESYLNDVDASVLVLAHTHIPFVRRFGERVVFNPGSVGQPRDGNPRASYAVFDTETREAKIHRIEYDIDSVAERIREVGLPERLAERLYFGV